LSQSSPVRRCHRLQAEDGNSGRMLPRDLRFSFCVGAVLIPADRDCRGTTIGLQPVGRAIRPAAAFQAAGPARKRVSPDWPPTREDQLRGYLARDSSTTTWLAKRVLNGHAAHDAPILQAFSIRNSVPRMNLRPASPRLSHLINWRYSSAVAGGPERRSSHLRNLTATLFI
jgi:hypothetical protein